MGYFKLVNLIRTESNKSYHENNYGIQSAVDSSKDQDKQIGIQAGCRGSVLLIPECMYRNAMTSISALDHKILGTGLTIEI